MTPKEFEGITRGVLSDIANFCKAVDFEAAISEILVVQNSETQFTISHPITGDILEIMSTNDITVFDSNNDEMLDNQNGLVVKVAGLDEGDSGQAFLPNQTRELVKYCFSFLIFNIVSSIVEKGTREQDKK